MSSTIALLGIAGNLLGSLNHSKPKDDFEAVKLIDENDPVRLTLQVMQDGVPPNTEIILNDGTALLLKEVIEIGYAAARVKIVWNEKAVEFGRAYPGHVEKTVTKPVHGAATIRYQAVSFIRQANP